MNKVQGWATLTHAEPFDLRVLRKQGAAAAAAAVCPQRCQPQLGGQRSELLLPSCTIKGRRRLSPGKGHSQHSQQRQNRFGSSPRSGSHPWEQ